VSPRILVAYDTKNQSTAEVAEAVAGELREHGFGVEVRLATSVRGLCGTEGLIVGAPIYSGRWLKGAHRALKRLERLAPADRPPVAIFALGPRKDESPEDWERPRQQFQRALGAHPKLIPVSTALFGGADPPKKKLRRDIRDWDAIRSWAREVAAAFARA
jgi:menaquinone-dependent protoporphyrinogen oxidase